PRRLSAEPAKPWPPAGASPPTGSWTRRIRSPISRRRSSRRGRTRSQTPWSAACAERGRDGVVPVRLRSRPAVARRARAPGARPLGGGASRPARSRHRAAVLRRTARQQGGRRLRLPPLRAAAVPLDDEVRVGYRLAQLLRALRPRARHQRPRPIVRHGARGDSLQALRRAPRPRLLRRAAADGPALLPQLRLAELLPRRRRAAEAGRIDRE